jgi:hypothetical protein
MSCPSCSKLLEMKQRYIDFGNIITCPHCDNKTYYPFEKPWYLQGNLVVGYVISLVGSFVAGVLVKLLFG